MLGLLSGLGVSRFVLHRAGSCILEAVQAPGAPWQLLSSAIVTRKLPLTIRE